MEDIVWFLLILLAFSLQLNLLKWKCIHVLFSEYIYFTAFVVCINLLLMQFDKFSYIVIRSLGLYLFSFFLFFCFFCFVLFFFPLQENARECGGVPGLSAKPPFVLLPLILTIFSRWHWLMCSIGMLING